MKLEDELEVYCKHVGAQVAFDLKGYRHLTTNQGPDVSSMYKLLPLLWALLNQTVPHCNYMFYNYCSFQVADIDMQTHV